MARAGLWSATLLVLLLPVLVAFLRIDEPPSAAEVRRVEQALQPQESRLSPALLSFYRMALPTDADRRFSQGGAASARVVQQARRAGILDMLAISLLLYLLLLLTRGRATALLAVGLLCVQPAVFANGHRLRPESPATMFALLSLLLWAGLLNRRLVRMPSRWLAWANIAGTVLCAGLVCGLAATSVTSAGMWTFLPALVAVLLASRQVGVFWRFFRRTGAPERWPARAAVGRLLPWVLGWFAVMSMTLLLKTLGGIAELPSVVQVGLLPQQLWLSLPLGGLAVLGGLRLIWLVGFRQRLRMRVELLLLVYVALALFLRLRIDGQNGGQTDALTLAPALALLMGEGAQLLLFFVVGRFLSGPGSPSLLPSSVAAPASPRPESG